MIQESEIGQRIRSYRKAKGMTLQELADLSHFSKGYLSKLEKSKKAPPLSSLSRIAKVLGVTTSVLLGEAVHQSSISFIKKNERMPIAREGTAFGYSYESIAYNYPDRHMQPFILRLPGKLLKEKVMFQHDSEEMIFALKGTMKFVYGSEEYLVQEGDCIYFNGNVPHYVESYADREAVCLMVMHTL